MNKIKNIIFDLNGVLFRYHNHFIIPINKGVDLLNQCYEKVDKNGNRVFKLFVCTNWKADTLNYLVSTYPDIFALFEGIVHSDEAGARKPNPIIFKYLIESYKLKIEECLHIDDQKNNVEAAELLGMKAIHLADFNEIEKLVKEAAF